MQKHDVAIIGAGAAGMAAAGVSVARGKKTLVIDMGACPARKVALSGGGRCNFTNSAVAVNKYFGENPNFVRGALARVRPDDILTWAGMHGIKWVEKNAGQYFCADGAGEIVRALWRDASEADFLFNATVHDIKKTNDEFIIYIGEKEIKADKIIIATGGISFPATGISDLGYKMAKKFGHKIVPPRPALCSIDTEMFPKSWAGISIKAEIQTNRRQIIADMLFTHFGIGGPAVYSASIAPSDSDMYINLMPGTNVFEWLCDMKQKYGRKSPSSILAMRIPMQIARHFATNTAKIADIRKGELEKIAQSISHIHIPAGKWRYHGMNAAEVTFGGISTAEISSKTMESKLCPGLYFAGEVIDVTGDLGGFNLHWAWASGRVAGQNI